MKFFRVLFALSLLLSAACSVLDPAFEPTQAAPTFTAPAPTPTRTRQPETGIPAGPVTLRVWLPVEFDPASGTPAGSLLQARLQEFLADRPQVRLDVRVKSLQDPGGLLEALSTASAAAPLALPDLVALPRPVMEAAALKGLLRPVNGLSTAMDSPEWYEFARQLALIQNTTFGLPFAGDALLMLYQSDQVDQPPKVLLESLHMPGPLAFAAADPQALYTLNLYLAAGGRILDEQGRPALDPDTLKTVLDLLLEAEKADFFPLWLTQVETDQQAWEIFQSRRSPLVVTWASRYLGSAAQSLAAAPLPTLDGTPFSLATGWVWSISSPSPDKQALAAELAEFLTEAEFLSGWTAAAGYLPPRADSLAGWATGPKRSLANEVILSMHLIPSADILTSLAPPLHQATIQILKQQGEPLAVAQEAAGRVNNP